LRWSSINVAVQYISAFTARAGGGAIPCRDAVAINEKLTKLGVVILRDVCALSE
jgi:hypothetical protein